ncbi:MAG: hypothetical protein ACJ77A_15030 [Actinomycetota bacterium]
MKKGAFLVGWVGVVALLGACGGGAPPTGPAGSGTSAGINTVPGGVSVGDRAPLFTLRSAQGLRISLGEFRGRKPVLLYFSMGPG